MRSWQLTTSEWPNSGSDGSYEYCPDYPPQGTRIHKASDDREAQKGFRVPWQHWLPSSIVEIWVNLLNRNLALALSKRPEFGVQAVPYIPQLYAPRKQRDFLQYYSDLHKIPNDTSGRTLSGKAFGQLRTTSVSRLPKMGNARKLIIKSRIYHFYASPITLSLELFPDNGTNYLSRLI